MKIVSWNYDSQFELAFREFTQTVEIRENQKKLGMVSKSIAGMPPKDRFAIYKINGSASFYNFQTGTEYTTVREDSSVDNFTNICACYKDIMAKDSKLETGLSFSWEEELGAFGHRAIDLASQLNFTNILVVIGYSFPFFNREADTKILKDMNLEKVYIQDKYPQGVIERFAAIRPDVEIIARDNVDQFYIPNELAI